jgi:hypothetical protein
MLHLLKITKFPGLLAFFLLFSCTSIFSQNTSWRKPIHAGFECYDVAIDGNDNIYTVGLSRSDYAEFFDSIPIPRSLPEGNNLYFAKTDSNNTLQWIKVIETSYSFFNARIKVLPNKNIVIAGLFRDRIKCDSIDMSFPGQLPIMAITQFDSTGKLKWMNLIKFQYWYGEIYDLEYDKDNNIYITGISSGMVNFGDLDWLWQWFPADSLINTEGPSSFIAKYSPSGKYLTSHMFPVTNEYGTPFLYIHSMIVDNEDNIYVTGCLHGKVQTNSTTFETNGIEILIMKLDKYMNIIWVKHLCPGSYIMLQSGNSLAFDKKMKHFYVTGNFVMPQDFGNGLVHADDKNIFLAKYSLDGNLKWIKTSGNWSGAASDTEFGSELFVDSDDFVYLGGLFRSTIQIGDTSITAYREPNTLNDFFDVFIAKYFANGDFSWALNAGSDVNDRLVAVVKDKNNHVFFGGGECSFFGNDTLHHPFPYWGQGYLAGYNDITEINRFESSYGINPSNFYSNTIKVTPNPFFETLNVEIQNQEQYDISVKLFNLTGETVLSDFIKSGNQLQHLSYQIPNRSPGIYFLRIEIEGLLYNYKVVKL